MDWQETLRPFNEEQRQLLLGTLLGDGCVTNCTKTGASYASRHGWCQHEYNLSKYQILLEFATRPPVKRKNHGFGEWSSFWQTKSLACLLSLRGLCYPGGRKTVTRPWLDLLTWEGIAWWIMDDGSLTNPRCMTISTHGFTEPEVRLMAIWLTERGVACTPTPVTKKTKTYWMLYLSVKGTLALLQGIKPYVLPCMAYKTAWKSHLCPVCGAEMFDNGDTCPICRPAVAAERRHNYYKDHQERSYARSRAWKAAHPERVKAISKRSYQKDITKSREKAKLQYQQRDKEALRAWRREHRQKLKGTPEYGAKLKAERQAYFARIKADPERLARRNALHRARSALSRSRSDRSPTQASAPSTTCQL